LRPGAIRAAVLNALSSWSDYVATELREAVAASELPADCDIEQLVFELSGIALAVQQALLLYRDAEAPDRARRAIRRLLAQP
jgi:tetracycline repressor-like protein